MLPPRPASPPVIKYINCLSLPSSGNISRTMPASHQHCRIRTRMLSLLHANADYRREEMQITAPLKINSTRFRHLRSLLKDRTSLRESAGKMLVVTSEVGLLLRFTRHRKCFEHVMLRFLTRETRTRSIRAPSILLHFAISPAILQCRCRSSTSFISWKPSTSSKGHRTRDHNDSA